MRSFEELLKESSTIHGHHCAGQVLGVRMAMLIESDIEDPRYFSEAQLKNRIDAFFESLEHKKIVRAGAEAGGAA